MDSIWSLTLASLVLNTRLFMKCELLFKGYKCRIQIPLDFLFIAILRVFLKLSNPCPSLGTHSHVVFICPFCSHVIFPEVVKQSLNFTIGVRGWIILCYGKAGGGSVSLGIIDHSPASLVSTTK